MDISKVVSNGMCIGCGTCEGICGAKAISTGYKKDGSLVAYIDSEKCISCGICINVCPSSPKREIGNSIEDIFHGKLGKVAYKAYAVDEDIRRRGQSGGVVTALMAYLMERGDIRGAATCSYNSEKGMFETHISQSKQDVLNSVGSNYIQIPHCNAIIRNRNKIDAAVLLGCQADALQKVKSLNLKYTFGLICAGLYKKPLLNEFGCSEIDGKIKSFRFRDKRYGGVPGDSVLDFGDNKIKTKPKSERTRYFKSYRNMRCMACNLKLNNKSDILFGDPWGLESDDSDMGYTVVIPRTQKGEELIRDAVKDGIINIVIVDVESVIKGQYIDHYKSQFYTVMETMKQHKITLPYKEPEKNIFAGITENKEVRSDFDYLLSIYKSDDEKFIKKTVERHKKKKLFAEKTRRVNSLIKRIKRKVWRIKND